MTPATPVVAIVDDEPRMRLALGRLLRGYGIDVLPFENGRSFLTAHAASPVDAIVLDLHMPDLSGFAVLESLGQHSPKPAVIIITGHDETGNAERVLELGAAAYLLKPVDEAPLLAALHQSLPNRFPEPDAAS